MYTLQVFLRKRCKCLAGLGSFLQTSFTVFRVCNILQYFVIFCNILQYFAIFCNILQYFTIFNQYFAILGSSRELSECFADLTVSLGLVLTSASCHNFSRSAASADHVFICVHDIYGSHLKFAFCSHLFEGHNFPFMNITVYASHVWVGI